MELGKVYAIISGKGGVGKTTSAINIGGAINSCDKEVVIIDANITTPNIGLHLGAPIVPVSLNHVLANKAMPEEAIYVHKSGMKILPASLSTANAEKIEHNRLSHITKKIRRIFDYAILDSSAGLGSEAKSAIRAADDVIIVANPEMASVTDALKAIKLAEQMRKDILGYILTRYTGKSHELSLPAVQDMLEVQMLGIVPEDEAVKKSQCLKDAVVHTHPDSKAAKAYHKITRKILGPEYAKGQAGKIPETRESIFRKLMKKMGF